MAQGNVRDLQIFIPFLHPLVSIHFPITSSCRLTAETEISASLYSSLAFVSPPQTHTLSGSILILCLHSPVIIVHTLGPLHMPSITRRHKTRMRKRLGCSTGKSESALKTREIKLSSNDTQILQNITQNYSA